MISAIRRFFYPQPVSQPQQPGNTSGKKTFASKPMTDEKVEQLYKQYVEEIMKAKGVTRAVAEAEVNNLG